MRVIRVHLDKDIIATRHTPFETFYVCRSEPKFAGAPQQVNAIRKFSLEVSNLLPRAVLAIVVDKQDIHIGGMLPNSLNEWADIVHLIVCWNDDQNFQSFALQSAPPSPSAASGSPEFLSKYCLKARQLYNDQLPT